MGVIVRFSAHSPRGTKNKQLVHSLTRPFKDPSPFQLKNDSILLFPVAIAVTLKSSESIFWFQTPISSNFTTQVGWPWPKDLFKLGWHPQAVWPFFVWPASASNAPASKYKKWPPRPSRIYGIRQQQKGAKSRLWPLWCWHKNIFKMWFTSFHPVGSLTSCSRFKTVPIKLSEK